MQGAIFSFVKGVLGFFKPEVKSRAGITRTYYDEPAFTVNWEGETVKQTNLRTRVASVTYQESPGTTYDQASHYSYDVHGNVKTLVVEIDNKKLTKRLDYNYDLVSGKVNFVYYQPNKTDQFIHRYEYDSDNRITKVFTSKDGVIWDNDAKYQYYAHGPLARTVTGELVVETQNFAYTLQGWIKGLNGQNFSYALGYNSTDYASINNTNLPTPIATGKDLYNGNIATWTSKNTKLSTTNWTQQFEYDQLNRIKGSVSLNEGNKFKTTYSFDPNGNMLALQRYNEQAQLYDNFQYQYHNTTNGYKENTNRLRSIIDPIALSSIASDDIDNQEIENYTYDEIGQMIADKSKEIEKVEWNLSSKPTAFIRPANSTKPNVYFAYDGMGNKVSKTVVPKNAPTKTTYYVRDATGNIMTEYTNTDTEHHIYGSSRLGIAKSTGKDYELTDHLGNVRTTISENGSISYAADYYPYGRIAKKYSLTQSEFGFNGKSYEEEIGLQDYGFRFYDPDGVNFKGVDPLTKKYPFYTPYSFAGNKPIIAIDLDGGEDKIVINKIKNGKLYTRVIDGDAVTDQLRAVYKKAIEQSLSTHKTSFSYFDGREEYMDGKTPSSTGTLTLTLDNSNKITKVVYTQESSMVVKALNAVDAYFAQKKGGAYTNDERRYPLLQTDENGNKTLGRGGQLAVATVSVVSAAITAPLAGATTGAKALWAYGMLSNANTITGVVRDDNTGLLQHGGGVLAEKAGFKNSTGQNLVTLGDGLLNITSATKSLKDLNKAAKAGENVFKSATIIGAAADYTSGGNSVKTVTDKARK